MRMRTPRPTRTDTLFPVPTLFRSLDRGAGGATEHGTDRRLLAGIRDLLEAVRGREHGHPVTDRGQGPWAGFGLEACGHPGLVDGQRQPPGPAALRRSTLEGVEHDMKPRPPRHRPAQFAALRPPQP